MEIAQHRNQVLGKGPSPRSSSSSATRTPPSAATSRVGAPSRSGRLTPTKTGGSAAATPSGSNIKTPSGSHARSSRMSALASGDTSSRHGPSPLGPRSKNAAPVLPAAHLDNDNIFSEDDDDDDEVPSGAGAGKTRSASTLERITKGAGSGLRVGAEEEEEDLEASPATQSLIRPSSSDAFFLAYSPSSSRLTSSAASTPRGKGKKRARLADGIEGVGVSPVGPGSSAGAAAGGGAGAGANVISGNAVLSSKLGSIPSAATKALFPRRRADDSDPDSDDGDGGQEEEDGATLRRWKRVWGTLNVPLRPPFAFGLSSGGRDKGKATSRATTALDPTSSFVPPFATHTLHALSTAHFRADYGSVPKRAFRDDDFHDDDQEEQEESSPNSVFAFWLSQLQAGFSLVFYGVGIGALPDTLSAPPLALPAPLFRSQPQSQTQPRSGSQEPSNAQAQSRSPPQHLLETFIGDVCAAGHGCAWIGHGLAPSGGGAGGIRASAGLKIEDVLSGCERAVRMGCGGAEEGEDDAEEEGEEGRNGGGGGQPKEGRNGGLLAPLSTAGANKVEQRAQRLISLFSSSPEVCPHQDVPPALFILIHSLDAPSLIQPKAQRILGMLGSAGRIHLMGTVRNVNAALVVPFGSGGAGADAGVGVAGSGLALTSERGGVSSKGKGNGKGKKRVVEEEEEEVEMDEDEERAMSGATQQKSTSITTAPQQQQQRLRWIWHSISTFLPSLPEALTARHAAHLAGVPSVLDFSNRGGSSASASVLRALGESSVSHILHSVSKKCRSLFVILAWEQLRCLAPHLGAVPAGMMTKRQREEAMEVYGRVRVDRLLMLAGRQFVASNMTDLGPLLKEFETHDMVERGLGGGGGGGGASSAPWITLRLETSLLEKMLGVVDRGLVGDVGVHVEALETAAAAADGDGEE
ncbi:unnamed protein product [Tilletia laevis]|uniref:Origin recognition complex subunit 2 RecA-like domain-containing protein n=1 Tax=Tilletia laevis TaxID=157183 RepID=A0A9N8Q6V0_9BASI|nr:unnamed protein product [Tilletia laevis]